ncbi:MAG: LLM class F420-dependent oxidoreductase [Actinomyces sp.]|nr:MAG: LLM class F420-dependent oxidoreductase [Actinomyces sp.]
MDLRIFVEPQQGTTYERLLALARHAETLGFDAFFTSDHLLKMGDGDGLPGPTDAWTTLAGLARDTGRLRLGTLVTPVTFRHPGLLAVTVAQVDAMSGGRVELGLGTGWYDAEHHAHGIPFPPLGTRFELLTEALEVVTGLWATPVGETFSYAGRHLQVVDGPGLPKPVQQPRPPLVMGGFGPRRTPRLAARFADEFNVPFAGPEVIAARRDVLDRACDEIGRDPASIVRSAAQVVCCGADEAEVERRAATIGRTPDEVRADGVAGTPDECVERLSALAAVGVSRVYLQVLDDTDLEHLDLLAEAVAPHVGGA